MDSQLADKLPEARGGPVIRNSSLYWTGLGQAGLWDVAGDFSEKVPTKRRRKWDKLRMHKSEFDEGICHGRLLDIYVDNGFAHTNHNDRIWTNVFE